MRMDDVTELRLTMIELLEDVRELLWRIEEMGPLKDQVRAMAVSMNFGPLVLTNIGPPSGV
jgi:hypothetical protein